MFGIDTYRKVFLYSQPCDMRKGFNGLHGLVSNAMDMNVYSHYYQGFWVDNQPYLISKFIGFMSLSLCNTTGKGFV